MDSVNCEHDSCLGTPDYDSRVYPYRGNKICLNCIPCSNCEKHVTPIYIFVDDCKSFLCRICYTKLIMEIFSWNIVNCTKLEKFDNMKSEKLKTLVNFRDQEIPKTIQSLEDGKGQTTWLYGLLNDIRGALDESPFTQLNELGHAIYKTTPEDAISLQHFDKLLSWETSSRYPNMLFYKHSESLRDFNNFLNHLPEFPDDKDPNPAHTVNVEGEIIDVLKGYIR